MLLPDSARSSARRRCRGGSNPRTVLRISYAVSGINIGLGTYAMRISYALSGSRIGLSIPRIVRIACFLQCPTSALAVVYASRVHCSVSTKIPAPCIPHPVPVYNARYSHYTHLYGSAQLLRNVRYQHSLCYYQETAWEAIEAQAWVKNGSAIGLGVCCAMSGTDRAYGAARNMRYWDDVNRCALCDVQCSGGVGSACARALLCPVLTSRTVL
eukprot:910595-Rhodomonas_salina.3